MFVVVVGQNDAIGRRVAVARWKAAAEAPVGRARGALARLHRSLKWHNAAGQAWQAVRAPCALARYRRPAVALQNVREGFVGYEGMFVRGVGE